MDKKKISQLTVAGALTGSELIEVVQSGVNKKSTLQDVVDFGVFSSTLPYRKVTADNDNILPNDYVLSVVNGGVEFIINLPDAATCLGKIYIIKKYDVTSISKIYIVPLGGLIQINDVGDFGAVQQIPAVWSITTYCKKFQSNGTDWEAIQ